MSSRKTMMQCQTLFSMRYRFVGPRLSQHMHAHACLGVLLEGHAGASGKYRPASSSRMTFFSALNPINLACTSL